MNISNNNWLINGAEKAYQNIRPQTGLNNVANNPSTDKVVSTSQAANKISTPQDILSSREVETLQALFDNMSDQQRFYGPAKTNNVQSGFLLDIKG